MSVNSGDIHGRIFAADGTPSTAEFAINGATGGEQSDPTVAWLNAGRFVVTWTDHSGTGGDNNTSMKARIFDNHGNAVTDDFLVNSTTFFTQQKPVITALPN